MANNAFNLLNASMKHTGCGKRCDAKTMMIKVQARQYASRPSQQLTSKGININVTLLFSREVCKRVAEAHIGERLAARGGDARISGKQALYIWA